MQMRNEYLDALIASKNSNQPTIKIITGIRGCGKTSLLMQYIDYLTHKCHIADDQIIYINFDIPGNAVFSKAYKLESCVEKSPMFPRKRIFIFLDEFQHVTDLYDFIKWLWTHSNKPANVDLYLASSNQFTFFDKNESEKSIIEQFKLNSLKLPSINESKGSQSILDSVSCTLIKIFPYSFKEYKYIKDFGDYNEQKRHNKYDDIKKVLEASDSEDALHSLDDLSGYNHLKSYKGNIYPYFENYLSQLDPSATSDRFTEYLEVSTFPHALKFNKYAQLLIKEYLDNLYSAVILKDTLPYVKIADISMIHAVLKYIFENIGFSLSSRKISAYLNIPKKLIDVKTVEKILDALTNSYLIYPALGYDMKRKQALKNKKNYYVADLSLNYILTGIKPFRKNAAIENVIYLELLRRGYTVYVGNVDINDQYIFVAKKDNEVEYYLVAGFIDAASVFYYLKKMKSIRDNYPKYLLTMNNNPIANYDGIREFYIPDWLLKIKSYAR